MRLMHCSDLLLGHPQYSERDVPWLAWCFQQVQARRPDVLIFHGEVLAQPWISAQTEAHWAHFVRRLRAQCPHLTLILCGGRSVRGPVLDGLHADGLMIAAANTAPSTVALHAADRHVAGWCVLVPHCDQGVETAALAALLDDLLNQGGLVSAALLAVFAGSVPLTLDVPPIVQCLSPDQIVARALGCRDFRGMACCSIDDPVLSPSALQVPRLAPPAGQPPAAAFDLSALVGELSEKDFEVLRRIVD